MSEKEEAYKEAQKATAEGEIAASRLRLSEQAAIMLNIDKILAARGSKVYSNFATYRDSSGSPGHIDITKKIYRNDSINYLLKQTPTSLVSSLLPSVKLYKVFYPNKNKKDASYSWRIPFDDIPVELSGRTSEFVSGSIDELLNGTGRLHGAAIKSFKYKYVGTNPAEVNTNIEASLELFFQDIRDLVKVIPISSQHPNFVESPPSDFKSLDFMYAHLAVDSPREYTDPNTTKLEYNERYFRLKAVVGYSQPSDTFLRNLIPDVDERKKFKKAIKTAKVVLYLNPYKHDIVFNENGTVTLTIQYIAAMTSILSSLDILSITPSHDKVRAAKEVYENSIESSKKDIERIKCDTTKSAKEIEKETEDRQEKARQQAFSELNALDNERNQIYSELFRRLIGVSTAPPVGSVYSALFSKYALGLNDKGEVLQNATQRRIQNIKDAATIRNFTSERIGAIPEGSLTLSQVPPVIDVPKKYWGIGNITDTESDDTAGNYMQKKSEKEQREERNDGDGGYYKVKFVFLGDVIDIFCSIIHSTISNPSDKPRFIFTNFVIDVPYYSNVALGTTNIFDTSAYYSQFSVNLADIPISLYMLQQFMLEKIIKPRRDNYPLVSFINDIMTEVVAPAVAPSVFGNQAVLNNSIRMSFLNLTVPFVDGKDVLTNESKYSPFSGSISDSTLKEAISESTMENPATEAGNYIIFYCSNQVPISILKGTPDPKRYSEWINNDEKNGVYHLMIGTDKGFIKKINFTRTNTSFYKEAKAQSSTGDKSLGRLREVYDVEITMFGNNVYRPGDFIYIEPLFFVGAQAVDLQNKLGLGGYYQVINSETTINDNIYETSLRTVLAAYVEKEKVVSMRDRGGC